MQPKRKRPPLVFLFFASVFAVVCGCCGFLALIIDPKYADATNQLPKTIAASQKAGVAVTFEDLAFHPELPDDQNAAPLILQAEGVYQGLMNETSPTDKTLYQQATQGIVQDPGTLERILRRLDRAEALYRAALKLPSCGLSRKLLTTSHDTFQKGWHDFGDLYSARAALALSLGHQAEFLPEVHALQSGADLAAKANFASIEAIGISGHAVKMLGLASENLKDVPKAIWQTEAMRIDQPATMPSLFRQWVPTQLDKYSQYAASCTIPREQTAQRQQQVTFLCGWSKSQVSQLFDSFKLHFLEGATAIHTQMEGVKSLNAAEAVLVEPIRNLNKSGGITQGLLQNYYDQTYDWRAFIDNITACRQVEADRRVLICTLWAQIRQAKTGAVPAALGAELGELATDPFGGQALRYSVVKGQPVVSSVGPPPPRNPDQDAK